jgi:hypothetical protein
MYAVLAPGHFPAEARRISAGTHPETDFFRLQILATVNFRAGFLGLGGLVCSGLEYQIEHHLFPGISHVYYPQISLLLLLLRDFCRPENNALSDLELGARVVEELGSAAHASLSTTSIAGFPPAAADVGQPQSAIGAA